MIIVKLLAITCAAAFITLANWRGMKYWKEKAAFLMITSGGWLIAILLICFPNMKGPSEWISMIFKPLDLLLHKL
ncbi:hypothetical protein [Paenibacillus spongiae]|uniref:Uncharacterized protein n=1 Tax=Paenibacillus spongiae TaxID=2909671 RepID=A0ABY5S4E8_9BACL|nr:hypothetical protein [Paenibacillus spongiae]UVI28751.1 hypothetical protein L1F29_25415 [Paenibacillus spongiae]